MNEGHEGVVATLKPRQSHVTRPAHLSSTPISTLEWYTSQSRQKKSPPQIIVYLSTWGERSVLVLGTLIALAVILLRISAKEVQTCCEPVIADEPSLTHIRWEGVAAMLSLSNNNVRIE